LGAVKVGDSELFIELTGTDLRAVTLSASIAACDLYDQGWVIEPVEICYDYDTDFGKSWVSPYYFQEPVFCPLDLVTKILGEKLDIEECRAALTHTGCKTKADVGQNGEAGFTLFPPEYRNDFLHAADAVEEVMVGRGIKSFKPERPHAFTVGRLLPVTHFSRRVKEIFFGLGFQEMIYNYLGSRADLVEKMRGAGDRIIEIQNPMTENYSFVRDSVLSSLLASESTAGHSAYPHKIFEVGKVLLRDEGENYGARTRQSLGFLSAADATNFNTIAAELQTFFYYIGRDYTVAEVSDSRFIEGRAAKIVVKAAKSAGAPAKDAGAPAILAGVFGEVHPEVLANWNINHPCTACEIDLETLLDT
jgi:phenylalanyl-tRNA synthetase beta chain